MIPKSPDRKSSKRITRSAKLRKYQDVYEACLLKALADCRKSVNSDKKSYELQKKENNKKEYVPDKKPSTKLKQSTPKSKESTTVLEKKIRRVSNDSIVSGSSRRVSNDSIVSGSSRDPKTKQKRPLNPYQKFVREESKKLKYKGMKSTDRMREIAKSWKKK